MKGFDFDNAHEMQTKENDNKAANNIKYCLVCAKKAPNASRKSAHESEKQAEAQQAKAVAAQKQTEFNQQKYNDELETQYVAVECPNCGSTGNKIRRTTVGYCPFCGTAIKVDQDGNVEFISRNDQTPS